MSKRLAKSEPEQNSAAEAVVINQPLWPTRTVLRFIFIILAVAAGLALLYKLRGVILLVVLSIFFAYLIAPLVNLISRPFNFRQRQYQLPRIAAIGITYLLLFGLLSGGIYLLMPKLSRQITDFMRQGPDYLNNLQSHLQGLANFYQQYQIPPSVQEGINETLSRIIDAGAEYLRQFFLVAISSLAYLPWLVIVPILAFFFLKDADYFYRTILLSLPRGRLRGKGAELFKDISSMMATYIRGQLTACLLVGVVSSVGFALIKTPYPLMFGVIAGLLEFIPLVGPFIVAVSVAGLCSFHSFGQAAAVLIFLAILRIVEDYLIYPRIIGRSIDLKPLAIILAILSGAELAGVVGIFLSVPIVAILSVCYRHWLEYRGSGGLLAELLRPADQQIREMTKES